MIANIALSAENFRTLVKGGTVQDEAANGRLVVRIILSDIGFPLMRLAIEDADPDGRDAIQIEGDRQMILLALAELALSRPGFDYAIRKIAEHFHGVEMFEQFKETSADRVKAERGPLHRD